jgi:hypothetical protein
VPGLGLQNRKQGLGEYAVECGAVVEFAASTAVSGTVGGPDLQLKVMCNVFLTSHKLYTV